MTDSAAIPHDPQALAECVAAAMWPRDTASRFFGMHIVAVGPGTAEITMTVQPTMLNGHQTCHGGMIFTLADSAFAFACNSQNHVTVAAGCSVEFLAPAREGDVLTARAAEQGTSGRTGVYDVVVTNQEGRKIALFRGKSHRLSGHVLE